MRRPIVLVCLPHYCPAWKAGGVVRSVENLVGALGDEYDFRVVTGDRDLGDAAPYAGIVLDEWQQVGKAQVLYMSAGRRGLARLRQLISGTPHDLLYLNGFCSRDFSIKPLLLRRMGRVAAGPTVIAPRGEFHPSALSTGRSRSKAIYRRVALWTGLFRGVTWQASSEQERELIVTEVGPGAQVVVAADVASVACESVAAAEKCPGSLQAVFIGRIAPVKNLSGFIECLSRCRAQVALTICGPKEDQAYWTECELGLQALPANVTWRYLGPVAPHEMAGLLGQQHVLVLPTLGENFGHVIPEALGAGCPCVISDRTPWHGLEESSAGVVVPLEDPSYLSEAVERFAAMGPAEFALWRAGARQYLASHPLIVDALNAHRELFRLPEGPSVVRT
jgi:glycosyltransferase involved in cell wall biosynthesis